MQNKSESLAEQALKYLHGIIKGNADINKIIENEDLLKIFQQRRRYFLMTKRLQVLKKILLVTG